MELQGLVAVLSGLVVFFIVIKYGLRAIEDVDWRKERVRAQLLEARRWGGVDDGSR